MNTYAALILAALLAEYVLNLGSDLLNLRHLQPELPAEFRDTFDEAEYERAQAYTRTTIRFGLVSSTFGLAVLLVFWFAGGFEGLDTVVRGWGFGPIGTGLCYIGLLVLGRGLLALPFSLYSTFGIEERFGFNETTPRTFALDLLKSVALGVALGGPLLAAILWFFQSTGPYGWVYAWAVVTAVMLGLQFFAPRYLMPLFNDFEPLEEGALRESILSYADSVDFPVGEVYVMDGSRRSNKANAFFTGFGANRRIVLFDTLVEQLSVDELRSVVAHEMGHYKLNHIPQRIATSVVQTGVLFLLLSLFLQVEGLFHAFYVDQPSVYTGLLFFGLVYSPVDLLLSIPLNAWARRHEFQADRFAVETTDRDGPLVGGLKRLAETNLSNLTPHPLTVALEYSHPPLSQRIEQIRAAARSGSTAA
ncbi:M48 family metallopeptidase [Salinibacter ruber]|uniref:M48 family metallopeptidase n=1 Tax=Salinibacter ruber TaxID=146919 RepID=UPI00216940CC|nr:STE24 endopeptidase [Salinibacter ruber]MCS4049287.1 STE24 endopeptidase [Salinibacter ruber]